MSAWLLDVLDAGLPELTGERRDELAAAILESIPGRLIAEAIASTTRDVLKSRAIADAGGDLSRAIGRTSACALISALQASVVYEEPTVSCAGCGNVAEDCDRQPECDFR